MFIKNAKRQSKRQLNKKNMDMNREIKFRAWQDNTMIVQPMSGNYAAARFFGFLYEDAKVMQYTGLKDKNGKEIFEGDILRITDREDDDFIVELPVVFDSGSFNVDPPIDSVNGEYYIYLSGLDNEEKDCEVIGNIYESPELIKC